MNDMAELPLEDLTQEQADALEEIMNLEADRERKNQELREKLGQVLVKRRDAAVKFRAASGIERQWAEDQAYYEGEEDSSRSMYYKGLTLNSPLIAKPSGGNFKSKVFLNITRPYVETAASKVIEVLSPIDDRAFSVEPSLIPFALLNGQVIEGQALPPEQPQQPPQAPQAQAPQMINASGQPATQAEVQQEDENERLMAIVRKAALGAQNWIDDALAESGYNSELRKLVDDAARLGTGVMRGPIPTVRRSRKSTEDGDIVVEEIVPQSKCIPVWNCYPDPACGDDIHSGQFFIERDTMVEKCVRDLQSPALGYLPDAIEKVLEEGPKRNATLVQAMAPYESHEKDAQRFDVWFYTGVLSVEDVTAMGCDCGDIEGGVSATVTMINDTPVKAHLTPLDDGNFPYDFMCWQRTAGSPWGIGIARQIRACQAILNATVRSMMENAGLSSGPQIILSRGSIIPANGQWEITPRKVWILKPDADIPDVTKAFNAVQIPSIQAELLQAVDFILKMAENVTGLPILLQGQQGPNGVPETVGGMQILVSNASGLLRRMARIFDDSITKPHVTRYYEWMMTFGEDDSIKGDFQIVPRGSSALVAKDVRATFLAQAVPAMLANPAFGIDPARYFREVAKLNGLNAEDIQFTKAELATIMSQPPQPDPRVEAAQVAAEARIESNKIAARTDLARIEKDRDRDQIYVEAEAMRTQVTSNAKIAEMHLRRELLMLELAQRDKLSLDTIKAQLAVKGGEMDLQRELAIMGRVNPAEHIENLGNAKTDMPVIEPPGRAPEGYGESL